MNERQEPNWPLNRDVIALRSTEFTEEKMEVNQGKFMV
jgi:hypothetical protein